MQSVPQPPKGNPANSRIELQRLVVSSSPSGVTVPFHLLIITLLAKSMWSKVVTAFSDLLPPSRYNPRGKKLLYWGGLGVAYAAVLLSLILENIVSGQPIELPSGWELVKRSLPASALAITVFMIFRIMAKLQIGHFANPEDRMRLAFRALTSGNWDTLATVVDEVETVAEIQSWNFQWLQSDRSLSRLPKEKFEAIRDAIIALKTHEDALRLRLSTDYRKA